ncbi:MAG TPA: glycosyltransferase family 2 protein [Candidatus Eremiobacteraceae bacterium]|nr:glycosyltransferase family 2 protein [Candidatus Eremiobacteraceae bacterium]
MSEAPLRLAVIVPVAHPDGRTQRCFRACVALAYEPRTIAVVTDETVELPADAHFINLVTRANRLTSPAEKRDIAAAALPGVDAYVYLDDDAYPPPDWLDRVAAALRAHPRTAGVGGPGLMPDDQTFWERVSAAVMETRLGSGPLRFRFWSDAPRECDDFPAYNLAIRKAALDAAGGWATDWYGGEDTDLCGRLADGGGLIWYEPSAFVFHYRRVLVPKHFWQIQNVGWSRGCFIRAGYPRSKRWTFAGPPLVIAAAIALACVPFWPGIDRAAALAGVAAAYLAVALLAHPGRIGLGVRLALPFGIVVHHLAYTVGLIRGLLTSARRRSPPSRPSTT